MSQSNKWDRSSKADFDKAASGQPEVEQTADAPPKHDAPAKGPKPPGGHAPSSSAWDKHVATKRPDQGKTKDDPNLTKNFNNRSR